MEKLMNFITQQRSEWIQHRKSIGFFKGVIEDLFGSKFAEKQIEEYRKFCIENNLRYTI